MELALMHIYNSSFVRPVSNMPFKIVGISSPCDTTPCHNGGTCVENLEDWTYNCICDDGLSDGNCQDGEY